MGRPKKSKFHAGTDTGTLAVLDPAAMFTGDEWRSVSECATKPSGSWKRCIVDALATKTGRPAATIALVATGQDGTHEVRCGKKAARIKGIAACAIEK